MEEQKESDNILQEQKNIGKEKEKQKKNNPHDKGYKRIFKVKKNFLDFIKKYVALDWMQELTVEDIELVDKEFITDQFETYESDLVYKVHVKENDIYMFFIHELQSKNDFTMPFRLLVYMTAIWMDYFKNTDKNTRTRKDFSLPPIFPLVLYNGTESWTAKRQLKEMVKGADFLGDYIINFKYQLVSVTKLERDFITNSNTLIDNIFYADSFTKAKDWKENAEKLGERLSRLPKEDVNAWITWFQNALQGVSRDKKEEIVNRIRNGDVSEMCNSFEKVLYDERAEGRAEGIEKGTMITLNSLVKKGILTKEQAADEAKLTVQEYERIKEELGIID